MALTSKTMTDIEMFSGGLDENDTGRDVAPGGAGGGL